MSACSRCRYKSNSVRCIFRLLPLHLYSKQAARRKLHESSQTRRGDAQIRRRRSRRKRSGKGQRVEWARNAKYLVDARSSMRAQSICKMLIDSLVVNQFWLPAKCQSSRSRSRNPKMARQITWRCQSMQQSVSHSLSQSVSLAASHKLVAEEEEEEAAEAATPNTASSAIYVVHRDRQRERESRRS